MHGRDVLGNLREMDDVRKELLIQNIRVIIDQYVGHTNAGIDADWMLYAGGPLCRALFWSGYVFVWNRGVAYTKEMHPTAHHALIDEFDRICRPPI